MAKVRKEFRLPKETVDYVQEVNRKNELNSEAKAVELIIREHQTQSETFVSAIADECLEQFEKRYGNALTRIRLGANGADKNSQILIEILNTMAVHFGINRSVITDQLETAVVGDAKEAVTQRIANYRQKSLSQKK